MDTQITAVARSVLSCDSGGGVGGASAAPCVAGYSAPLVSMLTIATLCGHCTAHGNDTRGATKRSRCGYNGQAAQLACTCLQRRVAVSFLGRVEWAIAEMVRYRYGALSTMGKWPASGI